MKWYRCTKNIRGRSYLYWQKTYRVGRSVKTKNIYIGPASAVFHGGPGGTAFIIKEDGTHLVHSQPDLPFAQAHKEKEAAEQFLEWQAERNAEGIAEDQHYYDHIATPEEKKEMAATNPRLKLDPIVRMTDLSEKQQKEYLNKSIRKIKQDHKRSDLDALEYTLSKMTPEDQQSYLRVLTRNPEPGTIADLITPKFLARYNITSKKG